MQIRIGVQSVPKELVVETSLSADEVEEEIARAVREEGILSIRDNNGGRAVVPSAKLAYVEIGESGPKSVGFGSF
jgi:Protein of unknown function (DUF3107)